MNSGHFRLAAATLSLCALVLGLAGCNTKPSVPGLPNGQNVDVVRVDTTSPEEVAAVSALEKARAEYKFNLLALKSYYNKMGQNTKFRWSSNELANLEQTRPWKWENVPDAVPPAPVSLENADERALVENVMASRRQYADCTKTLIEVYQGRNDRFKVALISNMRDRLDPIQVYPYFPDSMLPPRNLQRDQVDAQAEAIFQEAHRLWEEGKGPLRLFTFTSYQKERKACTLFLKLTEEYPQYQKVGMAAYYIAEIYKEYFDENELAAYWYERAWTWDPNITEPARFQAAVLYDYRLQNKAKAVECYKLALRHDPDRLFNRDHAADRIRKLTGQQ